MKRTKSMTSPQHRQWAEARAVFGDMLLLWRTSNGWSGQVAEDWARACPDLLPFKILNSVWTGLELKRNERTAPATFRALGDLNQLLDSKDRGVIRDRRLRDRVDAAQPIRDADGRPWDHVDFYRAFWGEIEIPSEFRKAETAMTREEAEEWSERFRLSFRSVMVQQGLRPRDALTFLLREIVPPLQSDHAEKLENAVFGFADLDPEDSNLMSTAEGALQRWCANLQTGTMNYIANA